MKNWKCYRKTDKHKIESVFDEKGLKVCDINHYLNEESEANAKLIACAPEMLQLLEYFLDQDMLSIAGESLAEKLIEKATTI
jgi:hypothetical protein